jgi:hypothetical protein
MKELKLRIINFLCPKTSYKRQPLPEDDVVELDGRVFWEVEMNGNVVFDMDTEKKPIGNSKFFLTGIWLTKGGKVYSTNHRNLNLLVHAEVVELIRL